MFRDRVYLAGSRSSCLFFRSPCSFRQVSRPVYASFKPCIPIPTCAQKKLAIPCRSKVVRALYRGIEAFVRTKRCRRTLGRLPILKSTRNDKQIRPADPRFPRPSTPPASSLGSLRPTVTLWSSRVAALPSPLLFVGDIGSCKLGAGELWHLDGRCAPNKVATSAVGESHAAFAFQVAQAEARCTKVNRTRLARSGQVRTLENVWEKVAESPPHTTGNFPPDSRGPWHGHRS
jgi:hypothetical protein